ncbi:MAG TPA: prepilin-type N-terminal cleavage/methylation domain-containing protein [Phycisphaerae bacterium]|nr:prepilin-type N-terminal cleavage/methylation domain-containing protein [Phycisphaerae bacterium]HOJ75723.1 prepilin-type N-terminal cleavage/methylation domain-containing protein [Phycisphaerae bacterium]HOM53136.1 prepilin-type N-terminal cleavage/methylation domain-containing protein [Phycisphaerae bacterium]HON68429.1 prepilin-type N-terminal cleavage/methylation domain-containing protein [Phycisphaerae bacterium]HPP28012.1 prepilin-type N-terminal cleavage/methylation domain-containing 
MINHRLLSRDRDRRQQRRGFTLIEVLVVVAIIALLISILLPSMLNARIETKRVVCQTQLKEIHKGLTNYIQSKQYNNEKVPDSYTLGGWWFRYGAGARSLASDGRVDPRALPERFGMPALLAETRCLPRNNELWLCPDTPKARLYFQNSYAWQLFSLPDPKKNPPGGSFVVQVQYPHLFTRLGEGKKRPNKTMWVFDNWRFNAPTPTGARYTKTVTNPDDPESSSASGDKYLTIEKQDQYYPHSNPRNLFFWKAGTSEGLKARNINVLRLDGAVMRYDPDKGF